MPFVIWITYVRPLSCFSFQIHSTELVDDVMLYAIEFVEGHKLEDLIDKRFLEGFGSIVLIES